MCVCIYIYMNICMYMYIYIYIELTLARPMYLCTHIGRYVHMYMALLFSAVVHEDARAHRASHDE